jgi:hypothetical protein
MSGRQATTIHAGRGGRAFLAASALLLGTALARTAGLDGEPGSTQGAVGAGDHLTVSVRVEGAQGLAAFEAGLRFDPAVVRPAGIRLGAAAPHGSTPLEDQRASDVRAGSLALGAYNAAGRSLTGAGTLAVVSLEAIADGDPGLGLDEEATAAFDRQGMPIQATFSLREGGELVYLPSLNGAR